MIITHIIYLSLIGFSCQYNAQDNNNNGQDAENSQNQKPAEILYHNIVKISGVPQGAQYGTSPDLYEEKDKLISQLSRKYIKKQLSDTIKRPLLKMENGDDAKHIKKKLASNLVSFARRLEDEPLFKDCSDGRKEEIALCVDREECTKDNQIISSHTRCGSNNNVVCCLFDIAAIHDSYGGSNDLRGSMNRRGYNILEQEVEDQSMFHLDLDDANRDVLNHLLKIAQIDTPVEPSGSEAASEQQADTPVEPSGSEATSEQQADTPVEPSGSEATSEQQAHY